MKTVFVRVTPRTTTEPLIYMSRTQWEDAAYIPEDVRDRIVIVDFKEEEENE